MQKLLIININSCKTVRDADEDTNMFYLSGFTKNYGDHVLKKQCVP